MTHTTMQYGHWGISVATRRDPKDWAPITCETFSYPVGTCGPVDCWRTEQDAIAYCRAKGGEVKGPFFKPR